GDQVAVASGVGWWLWVPQAFEVSWTRLQFFNPRDAPPPAGVSVVEVPWPAGQPARASWPHAPAGWRVVAANGTGGWVAWSRLGLSEPGDSEVGRRGFRMRARRGIP